MLLINIGVQAQKNEKAAGLSLTYGSEGYIGARFHYNTSNHFRLVPRFNLLFHSPNGYRWSAGLDTHFLIPFEKIDTTIYPILGFNTSTGGFLNLGTGIGCQYLINQKILLFGEATISRDILYEYDNHMVLFNLGISIPF